MSLVKLTVALVAIVALGWGVLSYSNRSPSDAVGYQQPQQAQQSPGQVPTTASTPMPPSAAESISARDSSTQSLEADLKDVDVHLQAASQSSADAEASMKDTPGDVSY